MTATAASPGYLNKGGVRFREHLTIENMERRQADVRNFFVAESEEMGWAGVLRRDIRE